MLHTNWHERFPFTVGTRHGELTLHVRKLEFSSTTWKAYVGLTNRTTAPVSVRTKLVKVHWDQPFVYWAGPGIWWSTLERGASWYPGAGTVLTHDARAAAVNPAYPTTLAAGKSWFGTFAGPTAKVDKVRLLRIGFGVIVQPTEGHDLDGTPIFDDLPVWTTHEFKLPRVAR